jgi:hypothetical protein
MLHVFMLKLVDARRRWWGMFFLTVATALLIWGQTLLKPHLEGTGVVFLIYWLICFAFTGLTIFTALLDVLTIRRRLRKQQSELIERTISAAREHQDGKSTSGNEKETE